MTAWLIGTIGTIGFPTTFGVALVDGLEDVDLAVAIVGFELDCIETDSASEGA